MAAGGVAAANLTSTVNAGDSEGRPSVFELVSQQGFAHALRPAFFHIIKTLAERYPERVVPIFYRNFDEVYLGFDSLVQWHYILTRGATLSETFYGLERKLLSRDQKLFKIRLSYILSVILPYVQNKLEKVYQSRIEVDSQPATDNSSTSSSFLKSVLKYYPYFKALLASINLAHLLAYSFGYTEYHNTIFRLLGMRLSYASPDTTKFVQEKKSELFQLGSWSNIKRYPVLLLRSLGESVLVGVEMGSFFVQFLDWWYNDPRRERVVLTSLPIPPPLSIKDQNCVLLNSDDKNKCPLCRNKFRNATALSTSGLVYCYGCIVPYIKDQGQCPLTSLKSTLDHLIRIFP